MQHGSACYGRHPFHPGDWKATAANLQQWWNTNISIIKGAAPEQELRTFIPHGWIDNCSRLWPPLLQAAKVMDAFPRCISGGTTSSSLITTIITSPVGAWANVTSGRQAQTRIRQPSSSSAVNFLRSRTEERTKAQAGRGSPRIARRGYGLLVHDFWDA